MSLVTRPVTGPAILRPISNFQNVNFAYIRRDGSMEHASHFAIVASTAEIGFALWIDIKFLYRVINVLWLLA